MTAESPFPNVPDRLTAAVSKLEGFMRSVMHRYTVAATFVCTEYLRKDMIGPNAHPHTRLHQNAEGEVHWAQTTRIQMLGSSLFMLRNEPGFADVCRRLGGQNLRAAFYEAYAASSFVRCGYSILVRQEGGKRGEDFDFQAVNLTGAVNVEVTALEAQDFSEKTVLNALQQKRKQLPDTAPGVIFCLYPECWAEQVDIRRELYRVSSRFLRGTRRINVIIYLREMQVPTDSGTGALVLTGSLAGNGNPRHPAPYLMAALASNDQGPQSIETRLEFHDWVDWALGE